MFCPVWRKQQFLVLWFQMVHKNNSLEHSSFLEVLTAPSLPWLTPVCCTQTRLDHWSPRYFWIKTCSISGCVLTHKYIQITGDKYLWAGPFLWPIHANTLPGQKGCAPFIWFIKSWFKVSAYKMIFKSLYIISCIKTKEYIQVWKEVSIPNTHEKINALENKISITW